MTNNKKPQGRVDVIISQLIPKKGAKKAPGMDESMEEDMMEQDDQDLAYQSAAEEILAAVEAKDAAALSESLLAFVQLCQASEDGE